MALPEQIRKQNEAVQQLYSQLNSDGEGGAAPTETPPKGEVVDIKAKPADAPANGGIAPPPASEQPAGGEPTSGTEPPEPENIAHKYRTLQGMYEANVTRVRRENRELTGRIEQLEKLLSTINASQSGAAAPTAPTEKLVTEADVESYGDSIDMMRKVSREELSAVTGKLSKIEQLVNQMQTQVVPQVQNVARTQQATAEQTFWGELTRQVPNFREVNDNDQFQSWLLEVDPLTGYSRQVYLEDAQKNLDANRVARFFLTWLESTGQAANAQNSNPPPASKSELEQQIAPGKSRAGAGPATPQAKTYTPKDITDFFEQVRKGAFKGREAERDRIERDIFAAQREGRIQT
jgi:hypothetical protein